MERRRIALRKASYRFTGRSSWENISYDILVTDSHVDRGKLDELVDIMLETICTVRTTVRIAGNDYPAELVKAKFMKLDSEHIPYEQYCPYPLLHPLFLL